MELQELEKQAKKGDPSAQFSFGLILVLNNYYDEGKEFIVKSSEQQNEEALRWISIHQELTKALESVEVDDVVKGKKIDFWNLKKGYGTESFSFSPLSNEEIFIFCENKNDNDNEMKTAYSTVTKPMTGRWSEIYRPSTGISSTA